MSFAIGLSKQTVVSHPTTKTDFLSQTNERTRIMCVIIVYLFWLIQKIGSYFISKKKTETGSTRRYEFDSDSDSDSDYNPPPPSLATSSDNESSVDSNFYSEDEENDEDEDQVVNVDEVNVGEVNVGEVNVDGGDGGDGGGDDDELFQIIFENDTYYVVFNKEYYDIEEDDYLGKSTNVLKLFSKIFTFYFTAISI